MDDGDHPHHPWVMAETQVVSPSLGLLGLGPKTMTPKKEMRRQGGEGAIEPNDIPACRSKFIPNN